MTITIPYTDQRLRVLTEEYLTQQRGAFTLQGLSSYILYWAMEEAPAPGLYTGCQMAPGDATRVSRVLQQIVAEGRIAVRGEGEFEKVEN